MNPYNSNRKTWIAVIAAASGNLLEFYDFAVYAYFVATIAKLFFPNQDPVVSLLQTFAAYGIGFIARPFGSLIIGRIGDIKGRKPAMILTVTCMAIGSIGIGLVPSYESIGVAAPILLVSLRALQGFAAGGEYGTSTAFIVESSPPNIADFSVASRRSALHVPRCWLRLLLRCCRWCQRMSCMLGHGACRLSLAALPFRCSAFS